MQHAGVSPDRIVQVFEHYMEAEGVKVTRAMFEQNLAAKRKDPIFTADMAPLLAHGQVWNLEDSFNRVWATLVTRLQGEPWRGI